MAKDEKKLSSKEESELKALEEQEAAEKTAKAAAEAAKASAPAPSPPPAPAPVAAPKPVGDIPVMCLKTESFCVLGSRRYQLVKGQEIEMDPSHADELAAGGWVSKIDVG